MNKEFMNTIKALEISCNSIQQALPELREAGLTLSGPELVNATTDIGNKYGLVDLL